MKWSRLAATGLLIAAVLAGTSAAQGAPRAPAVPGGLGALSGLGALTGWQQRGASGPGGKFGTAVAVSGRTAVVGAPLRGSHAGAAYLFVRIGAKWSLQAVLTPSRREAGEQFGGAVAISGSTVVVGAAWEDVAGTGHAYVFVRNEGRWSQQAELSAAHGAYGNGFGITVAISHSTVVVGAPYRGGEKGAAYVFTRSGARWSQQAQLRPSPRVSDLFGTSVAVSGSTAVVGAETWSAARGTAFVFTRTGARWSQQARLTTTGLVANDFFGSAVALSGPTAVIGVDGWNVDRGEALVFRRSAGRWSQVASLTASHRLAADDSFGAAVSVSGPLAIVGTDGPDHAYEFARSATSWSQRAEFIRGPADDLFGAAVAVSDSTAVIGAPGARGGAAFVYRIGAAPRALLGG